MKSVLVARSVSGSIKEKVEMGQGFVCKTALRAPVMLAAVLAVRNGASRGSTFSTLRTMSSQCVIRRHAIGTAREISFGVDKGKG